MTFNEDLNDHVLFGLHYKATDAEQRALWMKLSSSSQSREWGVLRSRMFYGQFEASSMYAKELAEKMEDADQAMTRTAFKLIEEMIAARDQ